MLGDAPMSEVMDTMEQRAESTLQVLAVLETAQMMRVTREAIVASLAEEQRLEREWFRALQETTGVRGEATLDGLARRRPPWRRSRRSDPGG